VLANLKKKSETTQDISSKKTIKDISKLLFRNLNFHDVAITGIYQWSLHEKHAFVPGQGRH